MARGPQYGQPYPRSVHFFPLVNSVQMTGEQRKWKGRQQCGRSPEIALASAGLPPGQDR